MLVLWEFTPFPAGDYDLWAKRLRELEVGINTIGFEAYRKKWHEF